MQRVIAYVDGFNLYYGLRQKYQNRYHWLDLQLLATELLKPGQLLVATRYCTTRISDPPLSVRRQTAYIDALVASGVELHEGKFQAKERKCFRCGNSWPDHEEKQTDVNLAVEMLKDAHLNAVDVLMLISGDSDLTPAIRAIKQLHPDKRVIVAFPPGRFSDVLRKAAHAWFTIGRTKIAKSQFPNVVISTTGYELRRPKEWS